MNRPSPLAMKEETMSGSKELGVAWREDARPQPGTTVGATPLPVVLPGHWDTAEGCDMARRYVDHPRPAINMGSDMALANAAFMHLHEPLGTATKERMRWLSVHLALANQALKALLPEGWGVDDTMDHMPGVKLAREAIARAATPDGSCAHAPDECADDRCQESGQCGLAKATGAKADPTGEG